MIASIVPNPVPVDRKLHRSLQVLTTVLALSAIMGSTAHATSLLETRKARKPASIGFNKIGSPKKMTCSARLLVAKKTIKKGASIDSLLTDHEEVSLGTVNPPCAKYVNDTSGTCEVTLSAENLSFRYSHNTQGGNLSIDDNESGQSTYQSWTNEFEITRSGYLVATTWLTNTRGGLGGNKKAFQAEFDCQAMPSDW